MKTISSCPSCSDTDIRHDMDIRDHSVSGEMFAVFQCNGCGLKFTNPCPSEEAIGRYYGSEEYVSHTDTRKGLINRLYHSVRKLTLKHKRSMAVKASGMSKGALLDYGCGTGAFLSVMREGGWVVKGLEPDPLARANAKALHGIEAASPEALAAMPDGHFDVVTLWHVLEHVHRLHDTIEGLRRVLKPGGSIFIAVPNHASWDARHYGAFWAAWDLPRHLYHFSPDSMTKLLSAHGLTVTHMRPMWFDSFYVSMLSEKYLHGRVRLLPAVISGAVSNLMAFFDVKRCSSVIYQISKPA